MGIKWLTKISFLALLSVFFLEAVFTTISHAQTNRAKASEKSGVRGLLSYKDKKGSDKPVKTLAEWEQKRRQILDSMQSVMGKLPGRSDLPPMDIKVTESLNGDNYTRLTISFTAAQNENVTAYLYLPFKKKTHEKLPAMLVLHGTGDPGKQLVDGAGPLANRAIAKELAQRGYVVIAPDYPSYGDQKDYDFDNDRYESGTMKAIFNHMRCIDLLQAREEVDPDRIGVIGHSLGGHNSMFVGAFDKRIKVVVASCGWTLFDDYNVGEEITRKYGGRLGPWAQKRYMPLFLDKYKLDGEKIPFDFDEVIAAIAPRPFFSNSPLNDGNFDVKGVKKGIDAVSKVYHFLKADNNLQVRYPLSEHDFPVAVRLEAYRFIDKMLRHTPTVDEILNEEDKKATLPETKVLVKQPGRYIGWPTITRTKSNELLVVFSGNRDEHVCPYGTTQMIRSIDNGKSWSAPETINNTPLDDRDAGIVETKKGTLLVSWFTSLAFDTPALYKKHPEWIRHSEKLGTETKRQWLGNWTRRSTDQGKSWKEPVKQVVSAPHGPVELADNRLLYVGTGEINGQYNIGVEESQDDGQTWNLISTIKIPSGKSMNDFSEPHVVETTDGKLVAMFRYNPTNNSQCFLHQSESTDGGKSWSVLHETPVWGYPPHLIRLNNDWLLVVYGVRRAPYSERACLSMDGGKSWDIKNEITLSQSANGDLGYPASVQLDDGSVFTVYYQIDQPGEKTCLMATHWKLK